MKNLSKLRLDNNPGLQEDNSKEYERLLEYLDGTHPFIQQREKELKLLNKDARFIE